MATIHFSLSTFDLLALCLFLGAAASTAVELWFMRLRS